MPEPIDYNTLSKERIISETIHHTKKLPEGVYACPSCHGSGRVTTIYRDPSPNKTGQCGTCRGTGEITKCKIPDCFEPVPNDPHWHSNGLCFEHEEKYFKKLMDERENGIL